jgi:hypothetical protein
MKKLRDIRHNNLAMIDAKTLTNKAIVELKIVTSENHFKNNETDTGVNDIQVFDTYSFAATENQLRNMANVCIEIADSVKAHQAQLDTINTKKNEKNVPKV